MSLFVESNLRAKAKKFKVKAKNVHRKCTLAQTWHSIPKYTVLAFNKIPLLKMSIRF